MVSGKSIVGGERRLGGSAEELLLMIYANRIILAADCQAVCPIFGCKNFNTPALTISHTETRLQYFCWIP